MKLTESFINNGTHIWLSILLLGLGGVIAFLNSGRLDDPAFSIKTAVVASPPFINDDFGDVYGYFFSLYGDGYSNQELPNFAEVLRRELVVVPGVGKVAIVGVLPEEVQIELSRAQMTAANIVPQRLYDLLSRQNVVSNAGERLVGSESIRLHPTGEFDNVQERGNLLISEPGSLRSVYLRDIATYSQGVPHSPNPIYRANRQAVLSVGVSFAPSVNVIVVGNAIKARLTQLEAERPAGMALNVFYDQSHEVEGAVNGFIMNFLMALAIVIGTLLIFMGVRSGLVIAASLALNVLGTLLIMTLLNSELQRVSLGALVIALSMLVDNAIVIVEGVLVGRQRGATAMDAINRVVKQTMFPLLGATIIAVLAFAPIGLSNNPTGEYCKSLFQVLLISLMLSWFTALTLTPAFTKWAFEKQIMAPQNPDEPVRNPYDGWLFRVYRSLLGTLLNQRTLTLTLLAGLLVAAVVGFGSVRQRFFPPSNTPIFFVDLWLPQSTDIAYTEEIAAEIEKHISEQPGVDHTMVTVGQGALRFMLTYAERLNADRLNDVMIWSQARQACIPINNVVNRFMTEWEDPLIMRRDRMRTLTVQADPSSQRGETSADLLGHIKPAIDDMTLPHGYRLEWGGDYQSTKEAQEGLLTSLPIGFILMFIITVLMFSSVKHAIAIWLTVPLALIGVTVGFLLTGIPFGFMALIGLLSLSGMLIRNGIVLVEEIGLQREQKPMRDAIIDASTSRLRPILLTAFTTVLGLAPLLSDAFFQSMAVVIMFGLGFATVLTLLVLPVMYSYMNRDEKTVSVAS